MYQEREAIMVDVLFVVFFVVIGAILVFQVIPALVVAWGLLVGVVACWLSRKYGIFGDKSSQ
jgi:hypothetical protein